MSGFKFFLKWSFHSLNAVIFILLVKNVLSDYYIFTVHLDHIIYRSHLLESLILVGIPILLSGGFLALGVRDFWMGVTGHNVTG